jgi:hypothetical protein
MKIALQLISLSIIIILGCTSVKDNQNQIKEIAGISAVVGNEPFTHVAIITHQQKVYLINSSEEIKNLLLDNQGMYFNIKYIDTKDSANIHILQAIDASKL